MGNRQLAKLFLANFIIYVIGMGLFPVLPLYAGEFGASAGMVGLYMALVYIAITTGSLSVGWIPANVSRKAVFVAAGVLGVPALALLGQATAFWQVVLLTGIVWFSGGVGTSLVSLYTGMIAEKSDRGRSFSVMFLAKPLAGIAGGAIVAWLVSWGGYAPTFGIMALIWAVMPVVAFFGLPDLRPKTQVREQQDKAGEKIQLGWQFYVLMIMLLLATIAAYSSRLGISLSLIELNFDAAAAASIAIASSLITLPLVPLLGALSDRLGRYRFLVIGSLMTTAGSLILLAATQLWQFWLAGGLLLASMTVTATVASAMGTDLLSPQALGKGLPRLSAMTWLAGVVGFLGAGYLVETLGASTLYISAVALSILASLLVLELRPQPLFVPKTAPERVPAPSFQQCLDEATEFTAPCSEMI